MHHVERGAFWAGFAQGYAPDANDRPPRPQGVVPAVLCARAEGEATRAVPKARQMWAPRAFLRLEKGEIFLRGPVESLWRLNRRSPGLLQTIDLIEEVGASGSKDERELRLLVLAGLHSLVNQGIAGSAGVHEACVEIIHQLGIDFHPAGWAARTFLTLPGQHRLGNQKDRQTGLMEIGWLVGEDVARACRNYVPVRVSFRGTKESFAPTWREVRSGLDDLSYSVPAQGTMAWRLMTPGTMSDLVWEQPLQDIGKRYGVSGQAVRSFCKQNRVALPSAGFWRMTEERRAAVRQSLANQPVSPGDG